MQWKLILFATCSYWKVNQSEGSNMEFEFLIGYYCWQSKGIAKINAIIPEASKDLIH